MDVRKISLSANTVHDTLVLGGWVGFLRITKLGNEAMVLITRDGSTPSLGDFDTAGNADMVLVGGGGSRVEFLNKYQQDIPVADRSTTVLKFLSTEAQDLLVEFR